jgi:hypothetical protein
LDKVLGQRQFTVYQWCASHLLRTFLKETGAKFGILVNNSVKIERVADNIIQFPAFYL